MADGLLDLILYRLPDVMSQGELSRATKPMKSEYTWIKICDMKEELGGDFPVQGSSNINPNGIVTTGTTTIKLELTGQKANKKIEKKWDQCYFKNHAAALINKNIRMWLGKIKLKNLKRTKFAGKIQAALPGSKEH